MVGRPHLRGPSAKRPANPALPISGFSVLVLVCVGCLLFMGPGQYACAVSTGFGNAMVESLEACPVVVDKLGKPISIGFIAPGCANYAQGPDEGGEGRAWGSFPVTGPKGRASVEYIMQRNHGIWFAERLLLTWPDGERVDVKACSASLDHARRLRGLQTQCSEGDANACLSLSNELVALGRADEAAAARASACRLGLSAACGTAAQ